ncbi:hypothetical protein B0O80DRAFT_201419 [Mortierella sp. GBAus27b]|nr:hypothetical protein BGX31_010359 [Mortierella sp. GBA43]KAI8360322.1 hypothetical protein B0O80DRAFT_201419 [Mortierella sp. GBAus27b]
MSGSVAKTSVLEKDVETITTFTVEETVSTLEVTEVTTSSVPPSPSKKGAVKAQESTRELPLFSNPLLANATRANSVPIKPKTGRIKSGGKTVPVLRISAPKVDGEVVVIRRLDTDLVNATSMFNAAYPAISEKQNAKESAFIARTYEGQVEKSGALTGVWITIVQAKELSKEYGIELFMRPLLEVSSAKVATAAADGEEIVVDKLVSDTVAQQDADAQSDSSAMDETGESKVADVAGMKRRIEELEDQLTRDRKKYRGLVTVALGVAAASVIPQVLPFFS